ncbi:MAG TPA: hypothetical protein PLV68_01675, partial [Ilumatobacteraceae bacterium]|nr:hypothetical protein [Ilumatobacteraceae bacterium]
MEDIEGFNGAGLYTSYTGYLDPTALPDKDDHDKTIERAILRAWGSYWSFEAFEERRLAGIDHLSGAMGLTVHARFDDELELNNGVVTYTATPGGQPGDADVVVNVQDGDVDVTNPDPEQIELPEIINVRVRSGVVSIERQASSTLVPDGAVVLTDTAVRALIDQVGAVADTWRTRINAALSPDQQVQTFVLDF